MSLDFITEHDAYTHFITDEFDPMFRVLVDEGNFRIHVAVQHILSEKLAGNPITASAARNLINVSSFANADDAQIIPIGVHP